MFEKMLALFNSFFQAVAEAKIVDDRLEITIDTRTLILSLPEEVGGYSTPRESNPNLLHDR